MLHVNQKEKVSSILSVMDEKNILFHITILILSKCFCPGLRFRIFQYDNHFFL